MALDMAAGDQVLLGRQVLEHAPALEHLRYAEPRHVEGAQTLRHNGYKVPLMRNLVKRAIRGAGTWTS